MKLFVAIKNIYLKIRFSFYNLFLFQIDFTDFLFVTAQIKQTKIEKDESRKVIGFTLNTRMQAVNKTKGFVSFINPKYLVHPQVNRFSPNEDHRSMMNLDFESMMSPVNTEMKNSRNQRQLNAQSENIIVNLEPGKNYFWEDEIYFEFDLTEKKRRWQGMNWNEISNLQDSVRFQIEYYLPQNKNLIKKKLAASEDKLWENLDEIPAAQYLDEDFNAKLKLIKTQPIFFDFSEKV